MIDIVDVLIVDDERINLKLVEGILKGHDINLVQASSGPEALKTFAEHDYAVALLDVMMPGMDGFTLAEELRSSEATKTIPIIFITAISKEQRHVFRGYEIGAVDYLFKPVEPEILRSKVSIFAELHRKKRSLEKASHRLETTVAELEASKAALEASEQRYRMVADYIYDWESWIDGDGKLIYISPSCERISGYPPARFLEEPNLLQKIIYRDDLPGWVSFMEDDTVSGEESLEFRIYHQSSKTRWVSLAKHCISDKHGAPLGVRTSVRDITNRKRMERQLEHTALHDLLTGLPNRVLFLDRLSQATERSTRAKEYYAVLYINLDRFQAVNDHYGHSVGDKLVIEVGNALKRIVRPTDTVARFGGDEYGVLLEGLAKKSDAYRLVETVHAMFGKAFVIDDITFSVSASIGYEIALNGDMDTEDIVHNAQVAMNKAKEDGKNRIVAYEQKMREGIVNVLAVENDLKRALKAREFQAYYQPIVNLADGTLYGFEALARWIHPERGMVNPGEFIPVAEDTGLIVELGSQILEQACTTMNQWREKYPIANNLTVAVNISAKQFAESSLPTEVEDILQRSGLPSDNLKLEITETVVMLDAMKSVNQLNFLKSLGVMLSIDDFGTGYSSMSYLQKFPTDQLKIDLSFVQRMEKAPENIEIIRAIVNMAHSLRLRVVAEGIETERQRDLLYSLQCDYGQGYLYSRPLPEKEAEDFVKNSD
ncbi:two-component system response regulator [Pseudodesulfovibrio sediminis]|uniref:GGDEF domain-containing protein n=1 Tax=Pseudodesulfovibrio sediminis TaxID=2810563 RepID=A0ABM7P2S1_9BACT|nr:EAL domain-containing protein [Pseudodesulfovibrio sediminis]BCS87086.1 GGDEF domain-containing protein [Pseudodesulfovibrio sediminis]